MSFTAKHDLVRVFHLALHHVPAAGEVIHFYAISEQDVILGFICSAIFVDVFDRRILIPMCVGDRVPRDCLGKVEFRTAFGCGKPSLKRETAANRVVGLFDVSNAVFVESSQKHYGVVAVLSIERHCVTRLKFFAFNGGKLLASERAAIYDAFLVLERLALGDLDGAFIAVVATDLDVVGAVRPAKGDVSFIVVDAVVVGSGRDAAAAYRDSFRTVDAVFSDGLDAAAAYRDSVITVDAGTVCTCGRNRAAAYRDSFITVDAVAVCARGLDRAADYRDCSLAVDAGTDFAICGGVQNSSLSALPVDGQVIRCIDSIFTFSFNLHLRTVREDEMSFTAKIDLVRVFHLALYHVPAASEVAHVG